MKMLKKLSFCLCRACLGLAAVLAVLGFSVQLAGASQITYHYSYQADMWDNPETTFEFLSKTSLLHFGPSEFGPSAVFIGGFNLDLTFNEDSSELTNISWRGQGSIAAGTGGDYNTWRLETAISTAGLVKEVTLADDLLTSGELNISLYENLDSIGTLTLSHSQTGAITQLNVGLMKAGNLGWSFGLGDKYLQHAVGGMPDDVMLFSAWGPTTVFGNLDSNGLLTYHGATQYPTEVPEPSTVALLTLGLLGSRMRRKES